VSTFRIVFAMSLICSILVVGCASTDQPAPDKSAFQKKPVPPQWRGPGQPGGPAGGLAGGPAGAPSGPPPGFKPPTGS